MSSETSTVSIEHFQALRLRKYTLTVESEPQLKVQLEQRLVFLGTNPDNDVCVDDASVSRVHAKIEVDDVGYRLVDLASKNGTFIGSLRVREVYLEPGTTFRLGRQALRFDLTADEVELSLAKSHRFANLIGQSLVMREIFGLLQRVAPIPATVLIEGESGTGKELVAEAIHQFSGRKDKPFVVFDCSAVSRELIESELFGHVKGSFTGAVGNRKGAFEQAHGGTLFLDELGELALDLQPKLLRVIEKREVRPVGGERTIPVDVRVIAATNRSLVREVEQGAFREDLYYRFAVIRVQLPPLRKRPEDIPLLAEHFLREAAARFNRPNLQISYTTIDKLKRYTWPGNVRELKNYIERAALLAKDERLETRFLNANDAAPEEVRVPDAVADEADAIVNAALDEALPFKDAKQRLVEAFEKSYWSRLLERTDGNVSKAARIAGVHRKSVEYILRKLELTRDDIIG